MTDALKRQTEMNRRMQAMPTSFAIDRDPSQEAILYQPQGWPSRTATKGPLSNATFAKNVLASGGIVPPIGEGASVRHTDWCVGLAVLVLGACGAVAMAVAFLWRA